MSEQTNVAQHSCLLAIGEFIPLIVAAMRGANMNAAQLARTSGVHKAKLSRGLNGKAPIDLDTVYRILLVLKIDCRRALLAIGHFGDWHRYYDPDIEVLSGLIDELPETMAAARDGGERAAIGPVGIKQLACRISAVIADNDRKVAERSNSFFSDSDFRRVS